MIFFYSLSCSFSQLNIRPHKQSGELPLVNIIDISTLQSLYIMMPFSRSLPACPLRELSFESQPLSFYPNNLFPFKKFLLNLLPLQPLDKNKYFHTSLQIFIALNLFPMLTNSSATSLNIVFLYFIKSIHDFSCPDLIVCAPTTLQPLIPHSFKGTEVSHSLVNFFHTFS